MNVLPDDILLKAGSKCVRPCNCDSCPHPRSRTVGYRGNPKAKVVIVGESPGVSELQKGLPFIGPSGDVVEGCLPADVSEDDVLWLNAMQCLPPKVKDANKNTQTIVNGCRACSGRLEQQIREYPRDVILALGNGALWALTGNYDLKITQNRGKVFPSELCSRGIIAAVHPAFLLRGGGSYRKFRSDIEYAFDLAAGLPMKTPKIPTWNVAETEADVYDFIDYTLAQAENLNDRVLGADVETGGFDFLQDETLALGWCIDPTEVFVVERELLEAGTLKHRDFDKSALYGGPLEWCWHNGKFDIKFMRQMGYRSAVDHDTMMLSYVQDELRGMHDLEQVASDEIGAPDYKDMLKPYLPTKKTSYREIPKDVLNKYLALDVSNTKQIFPRMYRRVVSDKHMRKAYHKVLLPASELLADVEANGIFVDKAQQESNMGHFEGILAEHHEALNAIAIEADPNAQYKDSKTRKIHMGINPNSPAQVGSLLYETLQLGKPGMSTDADTLDKLPQVPAVKALKAYRNAAKRYGTYVKNLPDMIGIDGRVHSSFLLHGTATGRLSSRGPNLQNQPRDFLIRNQYAAEEGNILIEMDLDQAELRCLAALSRDPVLCEIYETGRKLHKEVSISLWGEDWTRRYGLEDVEHPDYIQAKEEYMRTKALNFGIVYGRTAPSIAEEFGITIPEAQAMIDGWSKQFPEAWKFINKCRNAPARGQNLLTPFGRRKRVGVVSRERLRDLQNEAANFPHQSIASDITLMSAVKVFKRLHNWGVKVVNLVHDAIIVECPNDLELVKQVCSYVTTEMEKTPIEWGIDRIPFSADAKTGNRWGELQDFDFAS